MKFLPQISLVCLLIVAIYAGPEMIDEQFQFYNKVNASNIAVFFYGNQNSEEYEAYQNAIPSNVQLFDGLEFYYIPSHLFKLNRPNPSLSMHRRIGYGDWLLYKGAFNSDSMDQWIRKNSFDPLNELSAESIDSFFVEGIKGFILLDFGEFQLIRSKLILHEFCKARDLKCGKVSTSNHALNIIIQLMRVEDEPGVSKLAFWNPNSQKLQLYTKEVAYIRGEEIIQLYEGRQGIVIKEDEEINFQYQEILLEAYNTTENQEL